MSDYAKNIQTIEDLWKKRIELQREGGGRMSESYTVDGFEVVFSPWHSESLAEDFMGVSVRRGGYEVFHSGMTKLVPSVEQAREIVETMTMLEEAVKVVGE